MPYVSNATDTNEFSKYYIGFPKGLNTIQDENLTDDKNLTTADNVVLQVDGVSRRPGTDRVFNENTNTKIFGSEVFYKKTTGVTYWLRIGTKGTLEKLVGDTWTDVAGSPTWGDYSVEMVQARDRMFIYNGVDQLRYFDGTSITPYTTVNTPTNLSVTPTGVTGSTAYSYRVEAINATGRTQACASVAIANGNATLSASNYNALNWDDMAGATAYNVFGRSASGAGEAYLDTVYVSAYNDTGLESPAYSLLPSTNNTTGGIIAKKAIYAPFGRQVAIGITEGSTYYPTRLAYSGTLDYIDAFVGGDYGGGWVDIRANDGGEIVDIAPYQGGVLAVKTNGIFKFYFTSTGLPAVDEIATSHGGTSYRGGQLIDNDYVYVAQKDNRIAIMTVGQQQNYIGDQLRTNDVSVLISDGLLNVNRTYLKNICTFFFDYKFGFAFTNSGNTENTEGYILDTRFGGWVHWDGLPMEVTGWVKYDSGSSKKLYGMSNSDGYMIEMFTPFTNDDGAAFTSRISTKSFNQGMFNVKKVYRNPSLWFKYYGGGLMDLYVYRDTSTLVGTAQISLSPSNSGTMVGIDLPGAVLPGGSALEMAESSAESDYPQEITMLTMGRSLRFVIIDSNTDTNWLFMGVNILYTPLEGMPLEQQFKVYLT